jgi:hypothetical protein
LRGSFLQEGKEEEEKVGERSDSESRLPTISSSFAD